MKKLLFISMLLLGCNNFNAQTCCAKDTTKGFDYYTSLGLSMSNTGNFSFGEMSYPSLEFGLMKDNFSFGLAMGRSSLANFKTDNINNYWYELKTSLSAPIGKFNGYALLGIGNYIDTDRYFIEYGAGFSYNIRKMGLFVQASNWDQFWYVTPGITYNF